MSPVAGIASGVLPFVALPKVVARSGHWKRRGSIAEVRRTGIRVSFDCI